MPVLTGAAFQDEVLVSLGTKMSFHFRKLFQVKIQHFYIFAVSQSLFFLT